MTTRIENQGATTPVYGRGGHPHSSDGVTTRLARRCAALALAFVLAMAPGMAAFAPAAIADETTPSPTTSQTTDDDAAVDPNSGYILDPQNLLGNDIAKVSDAITHTRERTGVQVRLIYVDSFNSTDPPDDWARQTLQSLGPAPNTVLLAVATNDGNLAVVVSPDSEEWLSSQQSVDALSEAASAPLTDVKTGESPDWARSAIDMMDVIDKEKDTATSHSAVIVGVVAVIGVVALAAVVVGAVIVVRRRREVDADAAGDVRDGEHAPHADADGDADADADDSPVEATADTATAAGTPATGTAGAANPHAKYRG